MNGDNNNSIRDKVLEKIKSGHVTMRPKWYFVLLAALIVTGIAGAILTLLYFASFTVFSLRQTGALFIPLFGPRGWLIFLSSFPWILLAIVVLCAVLLELLIRHYSWSFRHSILTRTIGILLLAVLGGVLISYTPFHRELFRRQRDLPIGGGLYRNFGEQRLPDVLRGRIISIKNNGFVLEDPAGATTTVIIGPATHLPFGSDFDLGGTVDVFGHSQNGTIFAEGIREIRD